MNIFYNIATIFDLILSYFSNNWGWIFSGVILCIIIFCAFLVVLEKIQAKKEKLRKEEEAEREEIRKIALLASVNETKLVFKKFLTKCLIIDSNIWLNEKFGSFFDMLAYICKNEKYTLVLFEPQFDEMSYIKNIKKSSNFGYEKNKRTQIAINRIEEFQKSGWLKLETVTINNELNSYNDPLLVKLITLKASEGVECTFISDDIELRIRVRQHLIDHSKANWQIVEINKILDGCRNFTEASLSGIL